MLRHEAWCAGHLLKLTLPWKWSPWHSLFASIIATFVIMMLIFYHSQAWYTPQFLNTNQSIALLEEKTTIEHINTPDKSSQTSSIIIPWIINHHQSSFLDISSPALCIARWPFQGGSFPLPGAAAVLALAASTRCSQRCRTRDGSYKWTRSGTSQRVKGNHWSTRNGWF